MSVLKGEGSTVILYGSTAVSTGARSYRGYLARPDLMGEWPTVVVVPPSYDATSSVNDMCRLIARHGIAAVAPHGGGLEPFVSFITNPAGAWSNAEFGYALLAFGDGAAEALEHAVASPLVVSVTLVDPELDDGALAAIGTLTVPLLGLSGRVAAEAVDTARDRAPQAEWVLYDGVEAQWWNINADEYVASAAADTSDRVLEFLPKALPAQI